MQHPNFPQPAVAADSSPIGPAHTYQSDSLCARQQCTEADPQYTQQPHGCQGAHKDISHHRTIPPEYSMHPGHIPCIILIFLFYYII